MGSGDLKNDQKDVVWRYAHCAGLWRRKQGRNFASLEADMRAGYEIVADGIAIEARTAPGFGNSSCCDHYEDDERVFQHSATRLIAPLGLSRLFSQLMCECHESHTLPAILRI